jgi:dienelactone hydrolase
MTLRLSLLVLSLIAASAARAETPRALPAGQVPDDKRLGALVTLNGYFPLKVPNSKEEWERRAERVRRQLLVANGLWPMPTRTPANAVVHGKVDREGYTVEKVYLESYPGHFVTGNLYRPKGRSGRLPAVLSPHGHWPNGRFHDLVEKEIRQQIQAGAERFGAGARSPLQARCVQLARMGCIVFHYDMVGYADSVQLAHGPGKVMSAAENWGFFSPQAEARLQTKMGLQTYNSLCALDWLCSREDVDPQRVAVTGASGGGTQTFILCAIDPRPAVAFPAVMVSTAMQGGCTCENASYLRVGAGNIEIAGLTAPRPLGMTAANDWTKDMPTKGFPELKQLYKLLGVEDLVMLKPLLQFGHNYNCPSREAMYSWVNQHLKLGLSEPIVEQDFKLLSREELSVWDASHPKPPSGDAYERSLVKWITEDSQKQTAALAPTDAGSLANYRKVVGGAVDVLIGRGVPEARAMTAKHCRALSSVLVRAVLVRNNTAGEELPAIMLFPDRWDKRAAVVWVSREGKDSVWRPDGQLKDPIDRLLKAGMAVFAIDLLGQGELISKDVKPQARQRLNGGHDSYAGYTFGYNHPLFAQRVHDVLSAVSFARHVMNAEKVHVAGLGGAGHWVLAARAQAGPAIDRAVADTAGFRFAKLAAIDDPDFLPGAAKYLDLPGMAALSVPCPLWLAGEGSEAPTVVSAAYRAAGKAEALAVYAGETEKREAAAVEWLCPAVP